jgi:3-methyladenine DNA glycosylase AlkD
MPERLQTVAQVMQELRVLANPRHREKMAYFGIQAPDAFGIRVPHLRALAKKIGRNHALALKLWNTGNHEARSVAAMIEDPGAVTAAQMEGWARGFYSWDIVDGCCCYVFAFARPAWRKAVEWSRRDEEFVKRAGFSLMAYLAYKDKQAPDAKFLSLLAIIRREAGDDRNFVKKAVNWSLRNIGKRNMRLNRAAIRVARELRGMKPRSARWIASDALRELESEAVQRRLRAKKR